MILILTQENDEHTEAVCRNLRQRGAKFVCVRTAEFPQDIKVSLSFRRTNNPYLLTTQDGSVDLRTIKTVWYRRPLPPIPHPSLNPTDAEFVKLEASHLIQSLYRLLRPAFWINDQMRQMEANSKPYQLEIAERLGFKIPKTLVTNDPSLVSDFFEECHESMIYKCFYGHGRIEEGRTLGVFTTLISRDTLASNLDRIVLAPCTFQEYVSKRVELRVTVMGRSLIAAEIDSQAHSFSKIDCRKPPIDGPHREPTYRIVTLSSEIKNKIFALMDELGLIFGCVDLIVTPNDEIVFLEINPNGQWYRIEELTGAPLVDTFCDLLVAGRVSLPANVS